MAERNRNCMECQSKPAEFACSCIIPALLICGDCYMPHLRKNPKAIHMPQPISEEDIEENKQADLQDQKSLIKAQNSQNIGCFRTFLLQQLEAFSQNRCRQIDEVMSELNQRADSLKVHIKAQKQEVCEKFDCFIQDILTTDQYDYLLSPDKVLELQTLFKVEYLCESPIRASFTEIFEPKDELKIQIPERQREMDREEFIEEAKVQIPIQIGDMNKFQTENRLEYFDFSNDDRTATFKLVMEDGTGRSSVKTVCKSSEQSSLKMKFIANYKGIHFGL